VTFTGPAANAAWIEQEGFQYEVWQDEARDLAVYYGAAANRRAAFPDRVTRVLDAEGNLVLEYNDVNVGTSPADVLEDVTLLFGGAPLP
jgi:peroxiredoxin